MFHFYYFLLFWKSKGAPIFFYAGGSNYKAGGAKVLADFRGCRALRLLGTHLKEEHWVSVLLYFVSPRELDAQFQWKALVIMPVTAVSSLKALFSNVFKRRS